MAANHNAVLSIAGSSVTHATYAQLVAATAVGCTKLVIANATDVNVILAVGAAGSEIDKVCIGKGCTETVNLASVQEIALGSRLAVLAVGSSDGTTGQYSVSLL